MYQRYRWKRDRIFFRLYLKMRFLPELPFKPRKLWIQSCSAMDCTGLIPSLPQSFAEVEHYNDLYQFLPEHVSDPEE